MEVITMTITKETIIGEVLDAYPETAPVFFSIGMHCLGCPASRGESVADACMVHGVDADALIAELNKVIAK
jgi:hybrid cluster-associated redox disulfide protein